MLAGCCTNLLYIECMRRRIGSSLPVEKDVVAVVREEKPMRWPENCSENECGEAAKVREKWRDGEIGSGVGRC